LTNDLKIQLDIEQVRPTDHGSTALNHLNRNETAIKPKKVLIHS